MTNQEYIETQHAECEDCEWYGSKCHCQSEPSTLQQKIADLEARNAGLVEYIDQLLDRLKDQEMLTTMWKEEANNQRKNAARWQFEYNRAIRR